MRATRTAILSMMALVLGFAPMLWAQAMDFVVTTGQDDLVFSKVEGHDLVEVKEEKCSLEGAPGMPWLPVRNVHILIPAGSKAASVTARVDDAVELPGVYSVCPAQPDVRVSDPGPHPLVPPDPAAYAQTTSVRPNAAELVDTTILRGYHIAVVRVYPVDCVPATGRLTLRTAITLHIEMDSDAANLAAFTAGEVTYKAPEPLFENLVKGDVLNPEDLPKLNYATVRPTSPTDPNDIKYLLIGDSSMFDEFQPLLDWKTKKGVPAEAVDVSWVYANYSGTDQQEQIKACIKDYVQTKGTVWVVLVGDDTIIPDRDCYGNVNSGGTTDTTIPTDLYYVGLDDMNWDDDGDNVAGEVSGDTVDMAPDVYLGRLPLRTEAHATAIVNKTLQYEKSLLATGFAEMMILAGEQLWNTGDAEGKSEYMYDNWIDPYWTPVRYRFYDTNTDFSGGASYDVNIAHMNEQLTAGYNFFHMATHGNQTIWGMETGSSYSSTNAASLNHPNRYTNVLTMASITNAFENGLYGSEPCLSEAFIRNPNGGAVSYSGSSRYGWGTSSSTWNHGSSFKYDRMFYQFLFTGDPSSYPQQVGAVHTRMKEYWIGSCGYYGSMRWCQFAVNLMGDPEMCLYTYDPLSFSPVYPGTAFVGSQLYEVETGVANAKVCLYKGTEVYVYGYADGTGHYEATINPTSAGTMDLTITAPNYYPYEGTVTVILADDLLITPGESFTSSGPEGGPFTPATKDYTVTNTGSSPLNWSASKTASWIDLSNTGGTLSGGNSALVQVSSNATTDGLTPGSYSDTVRFTNLGSMVEQTRNVLFEVRPMTSFAWGAVASPQYVGAPFAVTVTAQDGTGATVRAFDGTVDLSGFIGGEVTVGTGTSDWNYPMSTYYHDARTQVIYLASELGGAGQINWLALDVTTLPGQTMNSWTIRMKHTALASYSSAAWESTGWTTVYQNNETVTATGWVTFEF